MMNSRGNSEKKPAPVPLRSPRISTWSHPALNQGARDEEPASNRLRCGTARIWPLLYLNETFLPSLVM